MHGSAKAELESLLGELNAMYDKRSQPHRRGAGLVLARQDGELNALSEVIRNVEARLGDSSVQEVN